MYYAFRQDCGACLCICSPFVGGLQAQKEEAGKEDLDQGKKAASSQPDPFGQPPGKWAVFAPLTDEFDELRSIWKSGPQRWDGPVASQGSSRPLMCALKVN